MTRWPLWKRALVGFAAMFVNDMILTTMVIFEAHYNATLAGLCDVGGWATGLVCSAIALDEIIRNGWKTRAALVLILAISAANFAGTFAGTALSRP